VHNFSGILVMPANASGSADALSEITWYSRF
jgi:hypothetical protein